MAPAADDETRVFRVCVTGFGPFRDHVENPAWLSTAPLNGKILKHGKPQVDPQSNGRSSPSTDQRSPPDIHITSFELRVSYDFVLSVVGPLHAAPPTLPDSVLMPDAPPSQNGPFDLILHVGVGSSGRMRIEARARRFGYDLPDVDGALAPIIKSPHLGFDTPFSTIPSAPAQPLKPYAGITPKQISFVQLRSDVEPPRGFGEGYEGCPYEIWNPAVNVERLVLALQEEGVQHISHSTDAGLYLCEFLYYASLAQSYRKNTIRRASSADADSAEIQAHSTLLTDFPKVLFVHVPPVGEPQSVEEMTFAIEEIVKLVCWGFLENE